MYKDTIASDKTKKQPRSLQALSKEHQKDKSPFLQSLIEHFDYPAIVISVDYVILATNSLYKQHFGSIDFGNHSRCFEVSHGYKVPCDQAGEECPLKEVKRSNNKERVLHIHQTPRGKEHVDVEMLPINDENGQLKFFIELLKPIPLVSGKGSSKEMVGSSEPFNKMLEKIARVSPSDNAVLLLGKSGTGKELAAKAIHIASNRKDKALISLECAGLTDTLFESELFGHIKGAFTGAYINKKGLVEHANGGTLFLDEIGDIPLNMQVKLLRLLEAGSFRQVGSTSLKTTDFRLVCATNKNLKKMVAQGLFREDLYYRISVFPIHLPSLDDRKSDIPQIAKQLLSQIDSSKKYTLTPEAIYKLKENSYQGNIRELKNLLSRAVILSDSETINKEIILQAIQIDQQKSDKNTTKYEEKIISENNFPIVNLKTLEREYLEYLIKTYNGDREAAAKVANISLRTLFRKIKPS